MANAQKEASTGGNPWSHPDMKRDEKTVAEFTSRLLEATARQALLLRSELAQVSDPPVGKGSSTQQGRHDFLGACKVVFGAPFSGFSSFLFD